MQIHEKMNMTKDEFLETQNRISSFLYFLAEKNLLEPIDPHRLMLLWLQKVKKPEWLDKKLQNDIRCIAYISKMVGDAKNRIDEIEYQEIYRPEFLKGGEYK